MKVYLHSIDPEFTVLMNITDDSSLSLKEFLLIYLSIMKDKFKDKVKNKSFKVIEIKNGKRVLNQEEPLKKRVKDKDDLFIKLEIQDTEVVKSPAKSKEDSDGQQTKSKQKEKAKQKDEQVIKLNKADRLVWNAEQELKNNNLGKANELYNEVFKEDSHNVLAYHGLAKLYRIADRPKKALSILKKLQKIDSDSIVQVKIAQCYLDLKKYDKALELLLDYCKQMRQKGGVETSQKHAVQVLLAKAYMGKNENDMAIAVLQGVLREDSSHAEAIVEYSPFLFRLGEAVQKEESLAVMLNLMCKNKEHVYIKQQFASMCQMPQGMDVLQSIMGKAWEDVPAVMYVANSLRDCGAIPEALHLMEHAYSVQPENTNTLLTWIHTMELVEQHTEAILKIISFLERFREQGVGNFKCKMALTIMEKFQGDAYLNCPDIDLKLAEVPPNTSDYSEDERYLLALMFTLVKMLYIKGALTYLKPLTALLDPCCENCELHTTNIRNENAYYACISKVVKSTDFKASKPEGPFVYMLGDSHCVTLAWRNISINGVKYTIHPVLSTGTKIWHLRDESVFYPKVNFQHAVESIPDRSHVIVCLGEIDCREALLHCVQQCRYDTLEDANNAVIDVYMSVLAKLQKENHWKIYVHPVMPILDPTRDVVVSFNEQLASRLKSRKELHWLDFYKDLLETDGQVFKLKPQFEFDGTHCHPDYLPLLQESLEASVTS